MTCSRKSASFHVTLHPTLPDTRNDGFLKNGFHSPNVLFAVTLRQSYSAFSCLAVLICLMEVMTVVVAVRVVVRIKRVSGCKTLRAEPAVPAAVLCDWGHGGPAHTVLCDWGRGGPAHTVLCDWGRGGPARIFINCCSYARVIETCYKFLPQQLTVDKT